MESADTLIVAFPCEEHALLLGAALSSWGESRVLVAASLSDNVIHAGLSKVNNDACYASIVAAGQVVECLRQECAGDSRECLCAIAPNLCVSCRCDDMPYVMERAVGTGRGCLSGEPALRVEPFFSLCDRLPLEVLAKVAQALFAADVLLQARCSLAPFAHGDNASRLRSTLEGQRVWACQELASPRAFDVARFAGDLARALGGLRGALSTPAQVPKVGVVGAPLAVYGSEVNAHLLELLVSEGCQPCVPYLSAHIAYSLEAQGASPRLRAALEEQRLALARIDAQGLWEPCPSVAQLRAAAAGVVPDHVVQGMGYSLAGHALLFWQQGAKSLVYASTFGCLVGHVVGQGILKRLRERCLGISIAAVEYDAGTSPANQINRVKLLTSLARQQGLCE